MKTDLVIAGYIIHQNKVLLIHHRKLNLWLPVGGHIDENETPDQALLREIKEEISIDVEILNQSDMPIDGNIKSNLATPFCVNVHSVGDHDHCCFFYVCKAINPEQLQINKELKNFKWFTKDDLNKKHVPVDVKNQALKAFELYNHLSK
ncbi:MAG TPA: NUDIX domain-containing protein [bacterium]|nr:NUDIX domain-containing protein [bacterium]